MLEACLDNVCERTVSNSLALIICFLAYMEFHKSMHLVLNCQCITLPPCINLHALFDFLAINFPKQHDCLCYTLFLCQCALLLGLSLLLGVSLLL